jgi:thiamine pyrophosphokinase
MKGKKDILIIANGEQLRKDILHPLLERVDCIIAVDGGSNCCFEQNIYPHYIIGDLDSINDDVLNHYHESKILHLPNQNRHDLDKALEFSLSLNPQNITVVGAFGKRLDHSIANLYLVQSIQTRCPISFFDNYGKLSLISGTHQLDNLINRTTSLFSFLPVYGLYLEGFKYPLANQDLPGGFNGLSNVIISDQAKIKVKSGSLFLYILYENITA